MTTYTWWRATHPKVPRWQLVPTDRVPTLKGDENCLSAIARVFRTADGRWQATMDWRGRSHWLIVGGPQRARRLTSNWLQRGVDGPEIEEAAA